MPQMVPRPRGFKLSSLFFALGIFVSLCWYFWPKGNNADSKAVFPTKTILPTNLPTQTNLPAQTRIIPPTAIPLTLTAPLPTKTCYWIVIVTTNHSINVRVGPGTNREVFRPAKPGEQFPFLTYNQQKTWIQVGVDQWIAANLVSKPQCA